MPTRDRVPSQTRVVRVHSIEMTSSDKEQLDAIQESIMGGVRIDAALACRDLQVGAPTGEGKSSSQHAQQVAMGETPAAPLMVMRWRRALVKQRDDDLTHHVEQICSNPRPL